MKIRAYESITIGVYDKGRNYTSQIDGYTLSDWKKLLTIGVKRCVATGRLLHDWEAQENEGKWIKVGPQPQHEVDESAIKFHKYEHGGELILQAVYYFEGE